MRYTVTGKQMKEIDRYSIQEIGIPSMVLMERAALAVAEAAADMLEKGSRILCFCGMGNNGADGIAAGRMLFCWDYQVQIILIGDLSSQTEEHRLQMDIAGRLGIPAVMWDDWEAANNSQLVIDALFGIGLTRDVRGPYQAAIESINRMTAAKILAVDICSGIHADTGKIMGQAVKADLTITFGRIKTGQMLYPGRMLGGELRLKDIGFPPEAYARAGWDTIVYDSDDRRRIPERQAYSNKGTYGRVLIVAGSVGMSGAAYFSAMAAYRMGAGLVKVLTVEENRSILQTSLPEAIIEIYSETLVQQHKEQWEQLLLKHCQWATVIVLGPGLGTEPYTEKVVSGVLSHADVPVVLDADGLNILARHPNLTSYYSRRMVVTPHLGEMARLCGRTVAEIQAGILDTARVYAAHYQVTCVLKDAVTVVADPDGVSYLNQSGCSAMAKGGSGDVLAGIIAGLLALGMDEGAAARLGVYLHGRAGEAAALHKGSHGVTAGDLLAYMTQSMEAEGYHETI